MEQHDEWPEDVLSRLCTRHSIGRPIGRHVRVYGGLLHRMYRIHTTSGDFAVKRLNGEVMGRPGVMDNFRQSEMISRAARQAGLPAVPALTEDGEPVIAIDGIYFMVFRWIPGTVLSTQPAEPAQCRIIGRLLAKIHNLRLSLPPTGSTSAAMRFDWEALLDRGVECAAPWANSAPSTLKELEEWTLSYESSQETLQHNLVISHRDLNQKNIVWSDERTPYLIDWEAAGPVNPVQELTTTALDWAGMQAGEVDRGAFLAFINGYREANGTVAADWRIAMNGSIGDQLQWLTYNMRRSLGELLSNPDDQETGTRECILTFASLREKTQNRERWCGWLENVAREEKDRLPPRQC